MEPNRRLAREKITVEKMIQLYCQKHGHSDDGALCEDCQSLLNYAILRIENCPFGVDKPACSNCSIHCYQSEKREKIRQVMRFSGPRMLLHHPYLALMHLKDTYFS